jgi:hypothetical protein
LRDAVTPSRGDPGAPLGDKMSTKRAVAMRWPRS